MMDPRSSSKRSRASAFGSETADPKRRRHFDPLTNMSAQQLHMLLLYCRKVVKKAPDYALNLLTSNGEMCISLLHAQAVLGVLPRGVGNTTMNFLPLSNDEVEVARTKGREIHDKLAKYRIWQTPGHLGTQGASEGGVSGAHFSSSGAQNNGNVKGGQNYSYGSGPTGSAMGGSYGQNSTSEYGGGYGGYGGGYGGYGGGYSGYGYSAYGGGGVSVGYGGPGYAGYGGQNFPNKPGAVTPLQNPTRTTTSTQPKITPEQRQKLLERISKLTPEQFQMLPPEIQAQAKMYLGAKVTPR